MMQAAQLAAEAAMQEAAAREASAASGHHHSEPQDAPMDMNASNENLNMDAEQMAFLQAMQAAEMGDQANMMNDIGMMGLDGGGHDESVQSLFHMLAQQEQENQRPDEHYLTIAQNGR